MTRFVISNNDVGAAIARRLSLTAVLLAGAFVPKAVQGQFPSGLTPQGAITQWLVLGPFRSDGCGLPAGCVPAGSCDWLADGQGIRGDEWEPQAGDEVASDCGGAAACLGWACRFAAIADPSIDCASGKARPRVMFLDSREERGYIDLNNFYSGGVTYGGRGGIGDPEKVMAYAWAYVRNDTGSPIEAMIGHKSDDSYRVLVNHKEVGGGTFWRAAATDICDTHEMGTGGC